MSHVQLRRDYFMALKNDDDCYIAAEFLSVERDQLFIVGDNKTYGGFYNAPLRRGETYRVWFGAFVTVDGVSLILNVMYIYLLVRVTEKYCIQKHFGTCA